MKWMRKWIRLSYCYMNYSTIEDIASYSFSENLEHPCNNVQNGGENMLCYSWKTFEKPFSIILQMTCWLWAWAEANTNPVTLIRYTEYLPYNHISKCLCPCSKRKREKKIAQLIIFYSLSKDCMKWLFSFSLKYSYYSRIIPLCYFMSLIPEKMLA